MHVFSIIVLFQKVLFLSTFCFLFLGITAQDTLRKKNSHVVGFGVQLLADRSRSEAHDFGRVGYDKPGAIIFYRFIKQKSGNKNKSVIFNSNLFYRKGSGATSSGGLGGHSSISGEFELLRLDFGAALGINVYKGRGPNIIGGANIGALIYSNGRARYSEFSGYNNYRNSYYKPVYRALTPINISVNLEINQKIHLVQKSSLLLGAKVQIETPEGFGAPLGMNSTFFIGYVFR